MPTAKVGDINIYYETHGEGEPLVLIMGYGANSGAWRRQVPVYSQEYRVVAFDNRGTGRSDKPDIPYTAEMMAGDAAGLLEAIGIDAAHIYGISMGGGIAQEFAIRYPEKAISVILGCTMCGTAHGIMPDAEAMTVLLNMGNRNQLTPEEAARALLPFLYSQEFIDNNRDIIEQSIERSLEYVTPPHGYARQTEAQMGFDAYDRLPQVKAPTLVIAGDADRIVPVENSRILASRIPNAELVILDNMGHGFFIEAEDETNRIILDFLRKHRR